MSTTSSDRMLSVMDLFTPEKPEWTVEEACAVLGQSESTVYRYFRSLSAAGLIFSVRAGRYLLGPGIVHFDRQLRTSDPLIRATEPGILEIAAQYSEPGMLFISRIHRDYLMTMHEHRLGSSPFPEGPYDRGKLAPPFAGAPALAIHSFAEVRMVRSIFRATGGSDDEWLEMKRAMRAIRANGYAADVGGEDDGIVYVSVPLKRADFGIAGSLTIALFSHDDDAAVIERAARLLTAAADTIAREALNSASR
ncbi:helix-turn-helix domain-containing protein [Herbiconiux sp. KACC 21604]|uniref:helix-turn-helix domain-containing protein n=1 Tax=unclassified Herbiconiux TaxID=2618217 RepID=UPI00149243B8|nr:helix-turn-helix domain-containing protein [Herbiconiux sp. SALV-R1]QJU55665.1 helix-turn-helix domain-containing protein [Herbiconiux sp. SALV-R1]WPO86868.1 helix-turn-helix domain-containing protein [Herbiconiux sp. KACC 21604]